MTFQQTTYQLELNILYVLNNLSLDIDEFSNKGTPIDKLLVSLQFNFGLFLSIPKQTAESEWRSWSELRTAPTPPLK
jgi:hypothetical protein